MHLDGKKKHYLFFVIFSQYKTIVDGANSVNDEQEFFTLVLVWQLWKSDFLGLERWARQFPEQVSTNRPMSWGSEGFNLRSSTDLISCGSAWFHWKAAPDLVCWGS